jgi:putative hydrolase of the HAD superfamily
MNRKWLFFDCMETLVDLIELPKLKDYAFWAFDGSGMEDLWNSFDDFFENYIAARKSIAREIPQDGEYEMLERMKRIVQLSFGDEQLPTADKTSQMLYANYWKNYKSKCYVKKEVKNTLELLSKKYRLAVVSNFMVMDGIEELLIENGIHSYFDFIVTSIKTGWRKPNVKIYNEAIKKAGAQIENITFIGDDYINDFITPGEMGMKSLLLDRSRKHTELVERVDNFEQLIGMLNKD